MNYNRPIVLSVAGYDPTGGAGVLADIKTFEQHRCLGMAVITALTIQTENKFLEANWLTFDDITKQAEPLFAQYDISVVKIGMIQNLETLLKITDWLLLKKPEVKIIWDTVLAASAGYKLLNETGEKYLTAALQKIYLITPNADEITILAKQQNTSEAQKKLAAYTHVLLKGGHRKDHKGIDILLQGKEETIISTNAETAFYDKHGSGCILSSAIAANLAWGLDLAHSCINAKKYIEQILSSNTQLLSYHHV